MCPEKGLDTLVDAFIEIRRRARVPALRLKVGGGCGPADEAFVEGLRGRLRSRGLLADVEFHPNLDRTAKIAFLKSLTVFSVPALYGEAFGMYLLEALAAGVPLVQPAHAAFPEVLQETGGGVLCPPGDAGALAEAIEALLLDPARRGALAEAGQRAVHTRFSVTEAADTMLRLFHGLTRLPSPPGNRTLQPA
jgi:glycosyltransferase involved in cell wall biosynthesis